jgi:DNA modification methylase
MTVQIINADVLEGLRGLPDESVHCCVTSPPYWGLRDYGVAGQIGQEPTFGEFLEKMVLVFEEVRRVLRRDGVCFVNMGDSYASQPSFGRGGGSTLGGRKQGNEGGVSVNRAQSGFKAKDLIGQPWRLAFALQDAGWWLRGDYIWHKPNPMPESAQDRCTKSHEYVFHLAKSERYFWNGEAIRTERTSDEDANGFRGGSYVLGEPGPRATVGNKKMKMPDGWDTGKGGHGSFHRNGREKGKTDKQRGHSRRHAGFNDRWDEMERNEQIANGANRRSVWTIATSPFPEAHFATFPPELPEICIKAGCPKGGTVLDPFGGAGTTGLVADRLQRNAILIELNPEYAAMAQRRINDDRGALLDAMEAAE